MKAPLLMPPKKPITEYEKLRAIWYKKLEKEGFVDIETDENNLKSWSAKFASKRSQDLWQAKEAYYYMATNFLNDYKFESSFEKIVWEYHTNAISIRDIVKLLRKKTKVTPINRTFIWSIVNRLETTMKKMYLSGYTNRDE